MRHDTPAPPQDLAARPSAAMARGLDAARRGRVQAAPQVGACGAGEPDCANEPLPTAERAAALERGSPPPCRSTLWHLDRHFTTRGYGPGTVCWAQHFIGDPCRLDGESADSAAVVELMTLVESSPAFEYQTPGARHAPHRDTPMHAALFELSQTIDAACIDERLARSNQGFEDTVLANPFRRASELRGAITAHEVRRAGGLPPVRDHLQLQRDLRSAQQMTWLLQAHRADLLAAGLPLAAAAAGDDLARVERFAACMSQALQQGLRPRP